MHTTHIDWFFRFCSIFLIASLASLPAMAATLCDDLGALEADPFAVSAPVAFQDINSGALISACTAEIAKQDDSLPRYLLQRGRGYLRAGQSESAIGDIAKSHELGYPAGTFALATAYHLGDDIKQDFEKARGLYEDAYSGGVRWAAKGLSMLYANQYYSGFDEALVKQWEARFGYDVPFNLTAKRPVTDKVLDHYQKECDARYERDIDFDDYDKLIPLLVEAEDFYDIEISTNRLKATVVFANFRCSDTGIIWSGSGGSNFYIIVGDDIFEGWGFRPYSIQTQGNVHVIIPRNGEACEFSDGSEPARVETCNNIANWSEHKQMFASDGEQLLLWAGK